MYIKGIILILMMFSLNGCFFNKTKVEVDLIDFLPKEKVGTKYIFSNKDSDIINIKPIITKEIRTILKKDKNCVTMNIKNSQNDYNETICATQTRLFIKSEKEETLLDLENKLWINNNIPVKPLCSIRQYEKSKKGDEAIITECSFANKLMFFTYAKGFGELNSKEVVLDYGVIKELNLINIKKP